MSKPGNKLSKEASRIDVNAFLEKIQKLPVARSDMKQGRLIFGIDATASREPLWDQACHIQSEMFQETVSLGGLNIQLVYYKGFMEFVATPWANNATNLLSHMTTIRCAAGQTQIARVIKHAISEAKLGSVQALIFIGDAMEENPDILNNLAGQLGILHVPIIMFQDGYDSVVERAFRDIARLSNGAYCQFDSSSAEKLKELLCAVAVFVAGGHKELTKYSKTSDALVKQLTHQLRPHR